MMRKLQSVLGKQAVTPFLRTLRICNNGNSTATTISRIAIGSSRLAFGRSHNLIISEKNVYSGCRNFSSTANQFNEADLPKMFPQLEIADQHAAEGRFNEAMKQVSEVHEIMCNATGAKSSLSIHLLLQHAHIKLLAMKGGAPIEEMLKLGRALDDDVDINKRVSGLYFVASGYLQEGKLSSANEWIDKAIELLEQNDNSSLKHFSRLYAVKGLTCMLSGSFDDAETYLQMAARWAQNRVEELICLSNLGALMWYRNSVQARSEVPALNLSLSPGKSIVSAGLFTVNRGNMLVGVQLGSQANDATAGDSSMSQEDSSSSELRKAASEALAYWEEAINLANQSQAQSAPNAADSMCGPVGSPNANSNGSGSGTSGMLGPDKSVEVVSLTASAADEGSTTKSYDHSEAYEVEFQSVYASILANAAMAQSIVSPTSSHCSELLATALAALDAKHAPTFDTSLHTPKQIQLLTKQRDSLNRLARGRVLGLISLQHLASGNMMTAEGLMRSAVSDLPTSSTSSATVHGHDLRYLNERALVLRGYGQMLLQWDKREREGEKLLQESNSILQSLSSSSTHSQQIPLSCLVQFPSARVI